jgi:DNA-binding NarL/FixJ family response regulator
MRILIVEAHAIIALAMKKILASAGHDIVGVARDLLSALRMAPAAAPDMALVDFHLIRGGPELDVARRLQHRGIACVFVSSNPDGCRTALDSGALGCLRKPFGAAALTATVAVVEASLRGNAPENLPPGLELYGTGQSGGERYPI